MFLQRLSLDSYFKLVLKLQEYRKKKLGMSSKS